MCIQLTIWFAQSSKQIYLAFSYYSFQLFISITFGKLQLKEYFSSLFLVFFETNINSHKPNLRLVTNRFYFSIRSNPLTRNFQPGRKQALVFYKKMIVWQKRLKSVHTCMPYRIRGINQEEGALVLRKQFNILLVTKQVGKKELFNGFQITIFVTFIHMFYLKSTLQFQFLIQPNQQIKGDL